MTKIVLMALDVIKFLQYLTDTLNLWLPLNHRYSYVNDLIVFDKMINIFLSHCSYSSLINHIHLQVVMYSFRKPLTEVTHVQNCSAEISVFRTRYPEYDEVNLSSVHDW